MIEITDEIKEEASQLLRGGNAQLPAQLKKARLFFVAEQDDSTVMAFGTLNFEGKIYKIGTVKSR